MGFLQNAFWVVIVSVALVTIPSWFKSGPPKYLGDGYAAPGWERVIEVFRDNLEKGVEEGAAFSVYYEGELVVNYAGGYADVDAEWKWDVDTLCQIYSSTKGVMATVMAMLVDRGQLDYEKTVATYWPEFAQNGKEKITVTQLLSHQAGLAAMDEVVYNHGDPVTRANTLAKQKPNWTPGEHHGYHALTIGLYMEELLRRVDPKHRDARQFFQEEFTEKYGIDVQMGLGDADCHRVSRVHSGGLNFWELPRLYMECGEVWPTMYAMITDPQSLTARAFTKNMDGFKMDPPGYPNNPNARRMTNPSAMGFATAEGLAKFWSIVANGGLHKGKRVISEEVLEKMSELQATGRDIVLLMDISFGRGITPLPAPDGREGVIVGTPGAGGQMGYADMERHLSWGYVTNHHVFAPVGKDPRYKSLISATYQVVDQLQQNKKSRS